MRKSILPLAVVTVLSAQAGAAPSPSAKKAIDLNVSLAQPRVLADRTQRAFLQVSLDGLPLESATKRPPVNLAVVIDRSGSMTGEKIQRAKDAAQMVVDRLGPDDILSVIAYDDTIRLVVPATKVVGKEQIKARIAQLQAGNMTALFAGVSKGIAEVRKFLELGRTNRIVLLSDGQANVGPSSPNELGRLGISAGKEGISVTTIGLGEGYNEDLMSQLAMASDGNHAFAASASDLATLFDSELGDLMSVCARNVTVNVQFSTGVRPLRALNRSVEIHGQQAVFTLNQVYAKQEKYVLFEVEIDPGADGSERFAAKVSARYKSADGRDAAELSAVANVGFTRDAKVAEASEDKRVAVAVVESIANETNRQAMELRDQGKVEEAKLQFQKNSSFLDAQSSRLGSSKLKDLSQATNSNSRNLAPENWNSTRKKMRKSYHEIQTQQSY